MREEEGRMKVVSRKEEKDMEEKDMEERGKEEG
jgi:hypothetical protein